MELIQDRGLACIPCGNADVGDGLREITLAPWGTVESSNGTFVVDADGVSEMISAFAEHGTPLPIDVEHETIDKSVAPGQRTGAVGWIEKVYADTGRAIKGLVRWTDRGRELIRSKAFPYLSPVLIVRVDDRKAIGLHSAALTVLPAIPRMERLAASQGAGAVLDPGPLTVDIGDVADALGVELIPGGHATVPARCVAKIKAMKEEHARALAASETVKAAPTRDAEEVAASVRSVLGLKPDADKIETLVAMGRMCHAAMTEKVKLMALRELAEPYIRKGVLPPHDDKSEYRRKDHEELMALAAVAPEQFHTILRQRLSQVPAWGRTSMAAPEGQWKQDRRAIIANAIREFQADPKHANITTCRKFINLALHDAGELTLHSNEVGLIPDALVEHHVWGA